jgi:hypothetical protein
LPPPVNQQAFAMSSDYSKKLDHELFEFTALDGNNYETWSARMMIAFGEAGIKPVVLGTKTRPIPTPEVMEKDATGQEVVEQPNNVEELEEWDHEDRFALHRIQMAVSDRELRRILHCKHAKEAWDLLRSVHKLEGRAGEFVAIRRLKGLKMEEGRPVQEYIDEFRRIIDDMSALSFTIPDRMSSMFFLSGLPASLAQFVQLQILRAQDSEQELDPTAVATSLLIYVTRKDSRVVKTARKDSRGTRASGDRRRVGP